MKFTLCAALPAGVMTLAAIYANHFHPSEPSSIALNLGMFASWAITGLLVSLYRTVRIIRRVFRTRTARRLRRIEPAPIAVLPDLTTLWKEQAGQDLIEYTLLLAFVGLAGAGLFVQVGNVTAGIWSAANSVLAAANQDAS